MPVVYDTMSGNTIPLHILLVGRSVFKKYVWLGLPISTTVHMLLSIQDGKPKPGLKTLIDGGSGEVC
jgi:hypothetical protein